MAIKKLFKTIVKLEQEMKASGVAFPRFSHSLLSMMKFLKQRYDMSTGQASHRRRYLRDS